MRITFDLPERTKAFHGCVIYDVGTECIDFKMTSWGMSTDELEDGMIIKVPTGERLDKAIP